MRSMSRCCTFTQTRVPFDELGEVDLSERRARDRIALEGGELLHASAELTLQPLSDLCVRPGRDLILKRFELRAELRRQEVRHDREELSDLDEQPLQSQDRRIDAASVASCA